jgi:hypothetical protein
VHLLLEDGRVGRTAAHGEVVAGHDDGPAADAGAAHHEVRGREAHHAAVVVLGAAGQGADLVERARVHECGDALADSEPAGFVLAGDLVVAAHTRGQLGATPQLVELGIPGHEVT